VEDALTNPGSATAIANGAGATVTRALTAIFAAWICDGRTHLTSVPGTPTAMLIVGRSRTRSTNSPTPRGTR
jgi:hypothetical protein